MPTPQNALVGAAGTTAVFALGSKMLSDPLDPSLSPELAKERLFASKAYWAVGGLIVGCLLGCHFSGKGRA